MAVPLQRTHAELRQRQGFAAGEGGSLGGSNLRSLARSLRARLVLVTTSRKEQDRARSNLRPRGGKR
jgi:hypothetical protein